MPDVKLSRRQQAIINFISAFVEENGYPPTIREIGAACNISSTSVVNYNLNKLERAGLLVRDREVSRGLRLVTEDGDHDNKNLFRVPLVGRIVASEPVPVPGSDFSIFGADESIEITRDIADPSDDLFALQVSGDSMVDAMINDGDIVIMRPHHDVKNGDMVAVWLADREETTLKRFYKEGKRIRLQPANPTMDPIYIDDPKSVRVQGRVVAVVRHV
ncbi:MAG TPA: transcriptional repressor LexA [Aggregatilineales bacterium]|jgi:repressor LexA|nr:transcriptional repressor LexA [Chloroflexota bacterium]HOA25195.1 transcriptional repressor LexA [Aggregatilineales bacterium]HPV07281.1 transcriptional repressor LexA [Aggregatilineales bacterium]HQA68612.1 transcriptional repressor LexA [Aggregatilineales bacterium]HQE18737.1 transcriptional repressor LexA [Aggregatilineales bacterium]